MKASNTYESFFNFLFILNACYLLLLQRKTKFAFTIVKDNCTYLVIYVCSKRIFSDCLLINEVDGSLIFLRVVPGEKHFFSEEKPPWNIFFYSLFLSVLLTLRNYIHYVIPSTTERPFLKKVKDIIEVMVGKNKNKQGVHA